MDKTPVYETGDCWFETSRDHQCCVVYETTNTRNGKIYVGVHLTRNVDDGYLGSGKALRRAIRKHGVEAFSRRVLYVCATFDEALEIERQIVTPEFCARPDTYNMMPGGKGGWLYLNESGRSGAGRKLTAREQAEWSRRGNETQRLLIATNAEFRFRRSANGRANLDWSGRKHKPESKAKIGAANRRLLGRANHAYGTRWMTRDGESKKINPSDVGTMLGLGWRFGRVCVRRRAS